MVQRSPRTVGKLQHYKRERTIDDPLAPGSLVTGLVPFFFFFSPRPAPGSCPNARAPGRGRGEDNPSSTGIKLLPLACRVKLELHRLSGFYIKKKIINPLGGVVEIGPPMSPPLAREVIEGPPGGI